MKIKFIFVFFLMLAGLFCSAQRFTVTEGFYRSERGDSVFLVTTERAEFGDGSFKTVTQHQFFRNDSTITAFLEKRVAEINVDISRIEQLKRDIEAKKRQLDTLIVTLKNPPARRDAAAPPPAIVPPPESKPAMKTDTPPTKKKKQKPNKRE